MVATEPRVKSIADESASNRNYHRKLKNSNRLYDGRMRPYTVTVCERIRYPYASTYDIRM